MQDKELTMKLKKGYTTGTCAQAAAKAAAIMLTTRKLLETVEVEIACGNVLSISLYDQEITPEYARCSVIKDSGDDPDVTNRAKIIAEVRASQQAGIVIKGGKGVGRVTKPGLPVPVGEYAINPVPRTMILKELSPYLSSQEDSQKGFEVIISVPKGEELAKQTFNPRLGIEGGISILGTTGIVEPKSLSAYKASLSLELDVIKAAGSVRAALVPGYVGEKFCKEVLGIEAELIVKIGDHVGFMLEECARKGIREVILAGHIGKLAKVANGQWNTHCQHGDGRLETIAHYARLCGASDAVLRQINEQKTAEAAIEILKQNTLCETFNKLAQTVVEKINGLVKSALNVSCYILSLEGEVLGSCLRNAWH